MPTYDGYLMPIPAGLTDNSRLTDQLASLEHLSFDDEMVIIASSIKGALTEGEIAENQLSLSGFLIPSFFDLFYNRIHIIPNFINFGDLASNQFRQVRVWNAYIDADKYLSKRRGQFAERNGARLPMTHHL